jgi:hypothetical protein
MEKVAEVAPDKYEFLIKMAEEVKRSPFRDEIVSDMDKLMKLAVAAQGLKEFGSKMGPWVAGAALGGVAMTLAGDMYDAVRRGMTKGHNYRKMLKNNPDLDGRDPAVKSNFSTLHRFNPEYSADPNVSGAYVRQSKEFPGDVAMVHGLAQSRQAIRGARKLPTMAPPGQMFPGSEERALTRARTKQLEQEQELGMPALRQEGMLREKEMGPLEAQKMQTEIQRAQQQLRGGPKIKPPRQSGRPGMTRKEWTEQGGLEGRRARRESE